MSPARAQSTNPGTAPPATKLEALGTNVSVVILKGTTDLGAVPGKAGAVTVKCMQITDTSVDHTERGIAVDIAQKGWSRDTVLIDYDEVARLLSAINYIIRLDSSATPLAGFDAAYITQGGLRIAAFGTRRTGTVQFAVRDVRTGTPPVVLSLEGISTFSRLIDQAKRTLDSLAGK